MSLNDICDALRLNSGSLSAIRGANSPHAQQSFPCHQDARFGCGPTLFWKVLKQLGDLSPRFACVKTEKRLLWRFKCTIHAGNSRGGYERTLLVSSVEQPAQDRHCLRPISHYEVDQREVRRPPAGPGARSQRHATGILNWWDHRISYGRIEGVNNKIRTRSRKTY